MSIGGDVDQTRNLLTVCVCVKDGERKGGGKRINIAISLSVKIKAICQDI